MYTGFASHRSWQVQDLPERWSVDSDSSAEVRLRQQPMASLGVEYANAVLPGMPATDWQSEGSRDVWWPPELKDMPMLKVPLTLGLLSLS